MLLRACVHFFVWFTPYFRTLWILSLVDCKLTISIWILLDVLAVLLSSLLRRPSPVNAAEARRISVPCCLQGIRYMFVRRGALHRRLSRLAANEAKRPVEALLKQLQVSHVEALAMAVESKGAEPAPCILLRAADSLRLGRSTSALPPHLLFCQLWRWADLKTSDELKKLPACKNVDSGFICCNPYHYSRLYKPDSPPPPYRHHSQELTKLEDNETVCSEAVGLDSRFSSNFSGSSESPMPWCSIAYWELSTRVGRLLPVSQPTVNIFSNLPHGDGLCLETLAQSCSTNNTSVLQTRAKIGQGITIFREDISVWVYNKSEYPIFVNSPTLDPPNTENLTVYKILPGYSIKIFDYEKSLQNQRLQDPSLLKEGPFDPHAVRVSFVKGWGSSKYSRRFITSCPCWLELMFLVNR